jgi:hypothetical protein
MARFIVVHNSVPLRSRFVTVFLLVTIWITPRCAHAQKENYAWHFGKHAGLDFRTTPPTPIIGSALNQPEGSASIADRCTGKTLFYSDGKTVWNKNDLPMPNGLGLNGDQSSTQSGTIIPFPGDPSKYYLFTSDQGGYSGPNKGVCYSVVDMNLNGGLGDVTIKNVLLLQPATEKLTAIPQPNGQGFWVLAHAFGSNDFVVYSVTAAGVNPTPVISSVGSVHELDNNNTIGCMVASPNGKMIADCVYGSIGVLELFDFDSKTGRVSNCTSLTTRQTYYGLSFSPDNSKLYVSIWGDLESIYQYDLSSHDPLTIKSSEYRFPDVTVLGFIRPGPDGNLYVARIDQKTLGIISNPNGVGASAVYTPEGIDLGTGGSLGGLPNIVDALNTKVDPKHEAARLAILARDSTRTITTNAGDTSEIIVQILDTVRGAENLNSIDLEITFDDNVLTNVSCTPQNGWSIASQSSSFGKTKLRITQPPITAVSPGTILLKVQYRATVGDVDHTTLELSRVIFNSLDPEFEGCTFGSLTVDGGVAVHVNSVCGDPTIRNYLNKSPILGSLAIYPNPTSGANTELHLALAEVANVRVRLYDAIGNALTVTQFSDLGVGEHSLPLGIGNRPNGMYYAMIEVGGERVMRKFIVNR